MAKARVHELAKELGVPSKLVLETLKDMGEFVKSASSTVEAPVVRKLTDQYGEKLRAQAKPAKKAAAKKAAEPEAPAAVTVTAPPEVEIAHGGPATQEPAHPSGAEQVASTPQPQLTPEA
ncbi:MAG: translation initiation factor IF-2 N-terminal domain-containing protein, partial [Nocardioidaceae bacterium]|nr:translation initiation factor IF-2 N-terminal domain-containing protein [Nocardioidaceae bacterium]